MRKIFDFKVIEYHMAFNIFFLKILNIVRCSIYIEQLKIVNSCVTVKTHQKHLVNCLMSLMTV